MDKNENTSTTPVEDFAETVDAGISQKELERIREEAISKAKQARHAWKMSGGWLKCSSCEFPHGSWVGFGYILTGIDEAGLPILKKL